MQFSSLKKLTVALLTIIISSSPVFADQSFEDFLKEQQTGFQQFKEERDREFTEFLKQQWREFKGIEPVKQIVKPKPVVIPEIKPKKVIDEKIKVGKPLEPKPVPVYTPPPLPKPVAVPVKIIPAQVPDDKPVEDVGKYVEFVYFSNNIKIRYDKSMSNPVDSTIDNRVIADYWKHMANTEYEPLLKQITSYRSSLALNDWGYLIFVDKVSAQIAASKNEKELLSWFLLLKSGFDAKIAYKGSDIHLLLPSGIKLFGVTYFTLSGKRYYALNTDGPAERLGSVYTYKESYPGAVKMLDFRLKEYPVFTGGMAVKNLSFEYGGKKYDFKVNYNINSKEYFKYYPQSDVRVYTTSYVPNWVSSSLLAQLKEVIKGKSEKEAVNMLLRFTQKAFAYKRDPEQFGREKFLFPEETIIYPYSDCEDRSIFFSYLVRSLVGLDTILLDYPGHIATAVRFNEKIYGDNLKINGQTYTICDPTFINADIGREMPSFKNVTPKPIKF